MDRKREAEIDVIEKVEKHVEDTGKIWGLLILPFIMELVQLYSGGRLRGTQKKVVVIALMRRHIASLDEDALDVIIEMFIAAARGAYTFTTKNIFDNLKCCVKTSSRGDNDSEK